jgi:hypothetical protein
LLPSGPHDEFLEVSAVSTSGELSEEEENTVRSISRFGPPVVKPFTSAIRPLNDVIPAIGEEQSTRIDPVLDFPNRELKRLSSIWPGKMENNLTSAKKRNGVPAAYHRVLPIVPESTWRHVWRLYAAGILLFVTVCLSAYWIGVRHGTDVARSTPPTLAVQPPSGNESATSLEE